MPPIHVHVYITRSAITDNYVNDMLDVRSVMYGLLVAGYYLLYVHSIVFSLSIRWAGHHSTMLLVVVVLTTARC